MITRPRMRRMLAVAALATAAIIAPVIVVPAPGDAAFAATYEPVTGSGSTWSQNALDQWRANVRTNYGMTVNYSGQGSTAGRTDFMGGGVDFAVSEIPFQRQPQDNSPPENPTRGYAYLPVVAGGTSFMYNLKIGGRQVTNLRLSGPVITKIFTGTIRNWNDPEIQADNPGLVMPDRAITPVVRSDGSGSSAQFTLWMSKQYPSLWTHNMTSQFPTPPNGKAQAQSLGVAGYVSQDYGEGAITYVEYSYALNAGFPVARVLNNAGYYIEPTANSVAVAMLRAQINTDPNSPDYLTQILDGVYNSDDPRTYPLSSYSYMIVPTKVEGIFNERKGNTLGSFLRYVLCEGQQRTPELGYSPLPMNLVMAGSDQIKRIPGAGNAGVDFNNCNNPTFQAGDSPTSNRLAATAPQPEECNRQGPLQCATGTAGAKGETPVSPEAGGGGGGGAAGGAGGAAGGGSSGGAAGGGTAGTAGGTGDAVYDESGMLISGGSGGVGGAIASPFKAADPGWGSAQWLMTGAAVILLAVIVAPAIFARRRSPSSK